MGTVRLTADLQQDGTIDHAIQEGHRQWRIAQVVAPGLEIDIGSQGGGTSAAACVDDLVEQIGGLGAFAAFDAVEAELVDDHQIETRPVADAARQALVGQRLPQVFQQVGAGDVTYAVSQFTMATGQGLEEMTFSDAALPHHDEVLTAADELAGGQPFDLGAVDRLGVELPVEVGQGPVFMELGVANPSLDGPLPTACGRLAQKPFQEVQVREILLLSILGAVSSASSESGSFSVLASSRTR